MTPTFIPDLLDTNPHKSIRIRWHYKGFGEMSSLHVPALYRCVNTAGQQEPVIVREHQTVDIEFVSLDSKELRPGVYAPNERLNVCVGPELLVNADIASGD